MLSVPQAQFSLSFTVRKMSTAKYPSRLFSCQMKTTVWIFAAVHIYKHLLNALEFSPNVVDRFKIKHIKSPPRTLLTMVRRIVFVSRVMKHAGCMGFFDPACCCFGRTLDICTWNETVGKDYISTISHVCFPYLLRSL